MTDMTHLGAHSPAEEAERLDAVERVYAGKSEVPIVDACLADANAGFPRDGDRDDYEAYFEEVATKLPCIARALEKEAERLRSFAQAIMQNWPAGDVDGGDLQAAAIKHGLLTTTVPREPCGEGCQCSETYDIVEFTAGDVICYRTTDLLTGAPTERADK